MKIELEYVQWEDGLGCHIHIPSREYHKFHRVLTADKNKRKFT